MPKMMNKHDMWNEIYACNEYVYSGGSLLASWVGRWAVGLMDP